MFTLKVLLLILTAIFAKLCSCKKYDNFTLFRGMPVNKRHLEFFQNLSDFFEVSFWRPPSTVYRPVEFIMPPEETKKLLTEAQTGGIYLTTIISDLQSAFDKQTVKTYIRRNMDSFDWKNYFRLKDIYTWLSDLSSMYPDNMKLFSIGKTYEGRKIMAAKISTKESKKRSTIIIEGGIHAREWISPAFVTYMMREILHSKMSKNELLKKIASTYEFYFIPVLNPDGYEYSHKEDRLWRKNREPSFGTDINRNFGYGFGTVGVSTSRDSEIYCGPSAFSEKESQALAELVKSKSKTLEYYLAFHSYGQYMIIPYGQSSAHSDNFKEAKSMGETAAKQLSRKYGTKYTVGTAYDTVGYRTSGVSGCWVKKTYEVPYVLTFELRDNGQEGFALSPNQILPTCEETMDAVLSFLQPRTKTFPNRKLIGEDEVKIPGSQENLMMDRIVVVCNIVLFIIVRFG